jgi:XTP/dITP diphosphohydrolase
MTAPSNADNTSDTPNTTNDWPAWATEAITIAPYDTAWPEKAKQEHLQLQAQLSAFPIKNFEHIGSTAVPGLPSKPIIDLIAEIASFDDIEALAQQLRPLGWHYVPPELDARPYRRFFIRVKNDARVVHLHLLLPGNTHSTDQIAFRDRLKASDALRDEYAAIKLSAATRFRDDREAYTRSKTEFIASMLKPTRIVFATNNDHKVKEIKIAVGADLEVISLREAGIDIDIPEPWDTLEANATEKSATIHRLTKENCFSEDTGLEVYALNGEPGVLSARYAGEQRTAKDNIQKVLDRLADSSDRKARFRTVISLVWNEKEYLFEGICEGHIAKTLKGEDGFGYDPIFIPEGDTRSFALMSPEEKNHYSHRRKAADQLVAFLRKATSLTTERNA